MSTAECSRAAAMMLAMLLASSTIKGSHVRVIIIYTHAIRGLMSFVGHH